MKTIPYCRNCGTQLADDACYCYKCGTPTTTPSTIIIHCQNCNTELNNNTRYCYKCGTPTTNSTPTPQTSNNPYSSYTPPTTQQQSIHENPSNDSPNKNSLPILTVTILIFTIIALIIAIVAFSPIIDLFNIQPFEHPGISTVNFHNISMNTPNFITKQFLII